MFLHRRYANDPRTLTAKSAAAIAFAVFAIMFTALLSVPQTASAMTLEEAAAKVEETSAVYSEAVAVQEGLQAEMDELSARIEELESQMPELKRKASIICRAMYRDRFSDDNLIDMVLSAGSIKEALDLYVTYNKVLSFQTDQLDALTNAKNELEESKAKLEEDKVAADAAVDEAKTALDEATAARQVAQAQARAAGAGALAAQIDWSMPKDEFVEHWAGRINSYLSGTRLAGHGESFADAAYEYGVDPRWSPAISRIESGCGAACFKPYNAWGWMGKSFSDWDSAIYAHVKYLSGPLYGGYLTPGGAATYCPPGGPWYSAVSGEMNRM